MPTFADRWYHMFSVTDPYGPILGFLDRSIYFSFKYLLSCTDEAEWMPIKKHTCHNLKLSEVLDEQSIWFIKTI
jgi:hypothetical protein